jgi:hypothetical protein
MSGKTLFAGVAAVCLTLAADAADAQPRAIGHLASISDQARAAVRAAVHEAQPSAAAQRRRDPLWNGAAIGAGVGLVIGLIGAERCGNDFGCTGDTWQFVLLGAGAGAGLGMGIDALLDRHRAVSSAGRSTARVRLAPALAGRTRGVRASVTF